MIEYRGYRLEVHPKWTEFGNKICFIKRGGLSVNKVTGPTDEAAIKTAKRIIDYWLKKSS